MADVQYFRLSNEELLMEAEMQYPWVDPRIWNEAMRRGIQKSGCTT
jgi:hypothetical protein